MRYLLALILPIALVMPAAGAAKPKEPPIPITSCSAADQPGRTYVLTADLDCATNGIAITAGGVTVDLRGFTIRGTGVGIGVFIGDVSKATVRNGTIENFNDGIGTNIANTIGRIVIANVASVHNTERGIETYAPTTIKRSTIAVNGANGIHIVADDSRITGSTSIANDGSGARIEGDRAAVSGSRLNGNGTDALHAGLLVLGSTAKVLENEASGNFGSGIAVYQPVTSKARIDGNTTIGNGFGVVDGVGTGVYVEGGAASGRNASRGNDHDGGCTAGLC